LFSFFLLSCSYPFKQISPPPPLRRDRPRKRALYSHHVFFSRPPTLIFPPSHGGDGVSNHVERVQGLKTRNGYSSPKRVLCYFNRNSPPGRNVVSSFVFPLFRWKSQFALYLVTFVLLYVMTISFLDSGCLLFLFPDFLLSLVEVAGFTLLFSSYYFFTGMHMSKIFLFVGRLLADDPLSVAQS